MHLINKQQQKTPPNTSTITPKPTALISSMAKPSTADSDPTAARSTELKRELQKLVRTIVDDEEYRTETIDQARETLWALRELKKKVVVVKKAPTTNTPSLLSFRTRGRGGFVSCPEEFKCPLSRELMRDPVILASGQTYDRPFIQKWLKSGNRTCPLTQQVLSHMILTPNHLIREMISKWCKSSGVELPDPVHYLNEEGITEADRDHFLSLLEKMSSSLNEQKAAAKELRMLTKRMPSFRALFGETLDSIPQLLSPLLDSKSGQSVHPDVQEDIITTVLNLSIHDNNKKFVAETPMVIPILMEALRSGTIETRANAAAALFTLSALDSNKTLIGKAGAIKPLIDLLEEGHPLAMKDVGSAIFNLCIIHENKVRAVKDGVVKVMLKKIMNDVLVDELLAIIAMLSNNQKAVEEMGELGAVPCLLRTIRESNCERNKENCIAILYSICLSDRTKWKVMRDEENKHGTISKLARDGTSRAKRKANGMLERLDRLVNLTHTA